MKEKTKEVSETILDKKVVLSVQQIFTYGAFLVTIGASIYTFFKAIPKIDKLDESVNQLQVSNTRVEERIVALKESFDEKKKALDVNKP
jgi:hypothetical protein